MRRIGWGLLACASVVCAASTASAQNHWYVEGSAGALLRDNLSFSTRFTNLNTGATAPGTETFTFSPGIAANLGLGYKLPFGFRAEGELGYAHYSASSNSPLSTTPGFQVLNGSPLALISGGTFDEGTATVNVFYDLPVTGLIPYIGGGFGGSLSGSQTGVYSSPGGVVRNTVGGGTGYIYPVILGEAGLTIAYSDSWALVPSYRFQHVFAGALPYNENIFKLGVRYSW
jgi:hypothetical protein